MVLRVPMVLHVLIPIALRVSAALRVPVALCVLITLHAPVEPRVLTALRVPIGERACRLRSKDSRWKKSLERARMPDDGLTAQWEVRLVVTESGVDQL